MLNRKLMTITMACWLVGLTGLAAAAADGPEDARLAITNWIRCIECADGELDRLTKFGQVIVPHLSTMLAGGPAQSARERVQQLNIVTHERQNSPNIFLGKPLYPSRIVSADFVPHTR